jgi:lipopolysaccharide export system protein LptA
MRAERAPNLGTGLMIALLAAAPASGLSGDTNQPITIDAGNVEVNHLTGVGIYQGDVVIQQGSLVIHAERAEIRVTDGAPDSVIIDGQPATFRQAEDDGSLSEGRAEHMEYLSGEDRLRLSGDAWVRFQGSELAGDVVDYDLEDEVARVGGDVANEQPQRVRVVIEPRGSSDDDQTDDAAVSGSSDG